MRPDPVMCAVYFLGAFTLAGVAQTIWLRSSWSRRWAKPLDGGRCWRGRRLLGDHKTWKGFLVMTPATALAFLGLALAAGATRDDSPGTIWRLSNFEYLMLGAWAGLGFMLGELPNSFLKRQLDIEPGEAASSVGARWFGAFVDQIDSVLGALAALACVVSVPWQTWGILLATGPVVHWMFNVVLWLLGVKRKAA